MIVHIQYTIAPDQFSFGVRRHHCGLCPRLIHFCFRLEIKCDITIYHVDLTNFGIFFYIFE